MHLFSLALIIAALCPSAALCAERSDRPAPLVCSYEMQVWNVNARQSALTEKISHPYGALKPEEIDAATGCTVCSEDQELISISGLPAFSVCHQLASKVRSTILNLRQNDAMIRAVVGYHVIRSRGPVDGKGNRTGFSNHSFGTAVDINPDQNGLYDNCVSFGPQCRLLRGGPWKPGSPGALSRDDAVVLSFKRAGFRWGGEIEGRQKDFMHFSATGY